jgi:ADP-ribose pyrophosphatase YjhB (NUDIX family)
MSSMCDHKSVGMLVWRSGRLLLIERAKYPKTYSIPAGHVDDHGSFEDAARAELQEEVGLEARSLTLVGEGRKENRCRREGGSWHEWRLYEVEADGEVSRSLDETKDARFASREEIRMLADRTEAYRSGQVTEAEWEAHPGLEPVMYDWFKELGII